MNKQEKELAIKIFDSLFGKFKISKLLVYPRSYSSFKFGLNCVINKKEYILRFNSMNPSMAATFMSTCNARKNGNPVVTYLELDSDMSCWPETLKISVIEECLKNNDSLYAVRSALSDNGQSIKIVPAAGSLEELAIKMELES